MKKTNVLILIDKFDYHGAYLNGPQRNYTRLLKNIDKKQFNIFLYTVKSTGPSFELFKREGIELGSLGVCNYNPFSMLRSMFKVFNIISTKQIDLLHLQGYASELIGGLIGAVKCKPLIVKEEWVDPNLKGIIRFVERQNYRFVTRVIAISNYVKQYLVNIKNVPEYKIALIPNGIPLGQFSDVDVKTSRSIRNSLGIGADDIVVGIVGMLHENKGHKYFIEAASQVLSDGYKAHFVIIGDGELRRHLEELVYKLDIGNFMHFMGEQERIHEILPMIDIFVSASHTESFGTCILEAMASGRAIITTQSGGGNELIHNGSTGIVVPIRKPDEIAKAVKYLIDNPEQKTYFARNAVKESIRYDICSLVRDLEALYLETISQYRKRRKESQ